jgi:hypothetical protein
MCFTWDPPVPTCQSFDSVSLWSLGLGEYDAKFGSYCYNPGWRQCTPAKEKHSSWKHTHFLSPVFETHLTMETPCIPSPPPQLLTLIHWKVRKKAHISKSRVFIAFIYLEPDFYLYLIRNGNDCSRHGYSRCLLDDGSDFGPGGSCSELSLPISYTHSYRTLQEKWLSEADSCHISNNLVSSLRVGTTSHSFLHQPHVTQGSQWINICCEADGRKGLYLLNIRRYWSELVF